MIESRSYRADDCAGFCRTRDAHGGLSNMASGFAFSVAGVIVPSTEHWYQMGRFPHHPDIQRQILQVASPMLCKRKAYEFMDKTRKDWQGVNIRLMKHALALKLSQNRDRVIALYAETGARPIVEISTRDAFWGAKPDGRGNLEGCNVLGRLHMGLRQDLQNYPDLWREGVPDPGIPDFLFLGEEVRFIAAPAAPRDLFFDGP